GKDNGSNGRTAGDGIGDTDLPFLARDPYPLLQDRYWEMPEIPDLQIRYETGSDRVDLSWMGEGKRYIVQRSTSPDFSTRLVSWSSADTALSVFGNENTTLFFRVRSFNDTGSRGWSTSCYVHVDQRPLPPKVIWLEPVPEGRAIKVSWEWEGEDIFRALIYYTLGFTDYNPVAVYYPESSTVITNLINGKEYSIHMITKDHSGLTSESSISKKETPRDTVPPPPPRDIVARTKDNETIVIEWSPPLMQDISEYILYRRELGSDGFMEVTRLSKSVLYYEDEGLSDNTTYEYVMASVDDDGPVSDLSYPVRNTTAHHNQRPIFAGSELIIYLMEDNGPYQSGILDGFSDPDGDTLSFKVAEYFPFKATIADGILWLVPEPDQAGEGYVQVQVSDGESYALFLIGVLIEPVEDPPRDVRIINPTNGSILLPGNPVTLEASGYDPDAANGDIMNVTWTSDRDGLLNTNTQSIMRAVRELSPGRHRITLKVEDRAGNSAEDSIIVMVSLWGWGDTPWRASFSDPERSIDPEAPFLEIIIENDSPLVLKFNIQGKVEEVPLPGERNVMIGPRSSGRIILEIMPGLKLEENVQVELEIEAATLNDTYAGQMEISDNYRILSGNDASSPEKGTVLAIVVLSVLALIGVGSYLLYTFRSRTYRKGD
ncbi:MAG: PKD domain-containing protein, partial [Thermoplasmatota archaeon]